MSFGKYINIYIYITCKLLLNQNMNLPDQFIISHTNPAGGHLNHSLTKFGEKYFGTAKDDLGQASIL